MVFREREAAEGLIDFRGGGSDNGISVGLFGSGVLYHDGIKGEELGLFFVDRGIILQSEPYFGPGNFSLPG